MNLAESILEILGALLSILALWLATGILIYTAIGRCIDQSFEVQPVEMLVVASCGVVFNIV
jgi:Co/Zn/Cd efflux system component